MDFFIESVDEAKKAAQAAESIGGNYVKTPGAYAGPISAARFKKFDSGSGGLELEVTVPATDEEPERILKVMIITLTKKGVSTYTKDGKTFPLPGMNQINGGLLPIVKMKKIPAVDDGEGGATYPSLIGKRIGCLVDIRKTNGNGKNAKKVYDNPSLVGFYCPDTNKTGSEILENKEAKKKEKIEAGLKFIDETKPATNGGTNPSDPFGDTGGSDDSDPFKEDSDGDGGNDTPELPESNDSAENESAPADEATGGEAKSEEAGDSADDFWN